MQKDNVLIVSGVTGIASAVLALSVHKAFSGFQPASLSQCTELGTRSWRVSERRRAVNEQEQAQAEYFGGCRECGQNDGYLNLFKTHWFRCNEHETRWLGGTNIFSSWQNETQTIWDENAYLLATYREVEPV